MKGGRYDMRESMILRARHLKINPKETADEGWKVRYERDYDSEALKN